MSANSTTDVAQRAVTISDEFGEMDIDVSTSSIEEKIASLREFSVPEDEAVATAVRNVIDEYELDSSDLSDEVSSLAGFSSGSGSSQEFDRVALEDIPDLGDEEWVDVRVQVVDLWDPNESMRQVGLIADETAQMKFVVWEKNTDSLPTLEEGVTYDIGSAVTNEYEGKFSISLNKASSITESEEAVEPTDGQVQGSGTLVALDEGSGLIKRCPHEDCTRVVKNGRCSEHGEVDGEFDLRLKAILDDGNRAVRALFNAEMTEAVSGISLEDATAMASEALDTSVVESSLRDSLIGRTFDVRGPVFGEYLIVDEVEETVYSADNPSLEDVASVNLGEAVSQRQPAKRVFASELNAATHQFTRPEDEGDDRAPKFALLPSGEPANRVFVVGALIETSDVGNDSEFWKGRVMAGSEVVHIYAGQYQQDAMEMLRTAETPCYVAVVGKVHHYETDYGVNVSIQPEHISVVDQEVRDSWMAEAIDATRARLGALESGDSDAADAVESVYGDDLSDVEAAVEAAIEDIAPEEAPAQ
jgi:RPA family protein